MKLPEKRRAIVSLISSATEMVDALGALDILVGRSHECDYPPSVRALPSCTKPLIDVDADSRTIDQQVKNSARSALSIYEVFDDVLERLQPTHILTQVQCDVCAVSLRDVERSIASRLASAPQLVALNPASLADVWNDFRLVGEAVGVDAEPVIRELQGRMTPVRSPDSPVGKSIKVACIEWIEPLMAAGNWTPELIDLAGGIDVFGKPGIHSPWITWDELRARDPDVIIVAPCGFDLARTRGEMHWIAERPGFACLKAVRTERLFLADGNRFFNRPGPRIVETLQIIRQMIGTLPASNCCDPRKMGRILKTLMGIYADDILRFEPLLDRLDRIEARLSAVESRPSLEAVVETALTRSVEDLRARLSAEVEESLTKFEGAIDTRVSLRIAKVETALIEQSVLITTLSQRAVDSEINLQRLISAVEKLFNRPEPSPFELPSDSGFRPRIVKEEDKTPRPRAPLTKL